MRKYHSRCKNVIFRIFKRLFYYFLVSFVTAFCFILGVRERQILGASVVWVGRVTLAMSIVAATCTVSVQMASVSATNVKTLPRVTTAKSVRSEATEMLQLRWVCKLSPQNQQKHFRIMFTTCRLSPVRMQWSRRGLRPHNGHLSVFGQH